MIVSGVNAPPAVQRDRLLSISETRYRRLFETARDGILLVNAKTAQIEDANPYLIEMLGYTHAEFLARKLWDVGPFADIAQNKAMFTELQRTGYVHYENLPLQTKAGTPVAVEFISNSYDCEGIVVVQCNIRNITDRTAAEAQASQRTRLYAALSQCNHTIVHCTTEQELFPDICRIAVELGGAKMAWIGFADAATGAVVPVASWGDANAYLKDIRVSAREDTPFGRGGIGRAIRENHPVWFQDLMHDPDVAPWREDIAKAGWATAAVLPLGAGGKLPGVFVVYSDNPAFFDEPARDLLRQLAMDISFALDGFAREADRKRAEKALKKSEDEFHTLAEAMPQIVWVARADGSNIYFNRRWVDYTGRALAASHGEGWLDQVHPDERHYIRQCWRGAGRAGEPYSVENRFRGSDGVYRWFLVRGVPVRDDTGTVLKWFGTCTDIHDLKTAEIKIRRLNRVHLVLSSINSLIVRITDRDEMFGEMCRIAVEVGGFTMSVMSLVDQSATNIGVVASAGKDQTLVALVRATLASVDDVPKSLAARALRDKTAVIVNDYEHDPRALYGKEFAESCVRSAAALPMVVADKAIGVITLYAGELNFFDDEEMALLAELVENIAFAIDSIGKEARLRYLAYYDELTGLANRSLFLERVGQYIRGAAAGKQRTAVFFLDLHRFKNINDGLGRPAGDALLKQVAEWLARNRGDINLVARLGADHFGVVLPNLAPEQGLERLLEDMLRNLSAQAFCLQGAELRISATAGVAICPQDGADAETLFRNAEAALKKAKARNNRYLFYTATMTNAVHGKLSLETRLREALDKEQFVLYYQPKVSLATGLVTSAEALVRWNDPRTGLVPPGQFIAILEETGLIREVGNWALGSAIKDFLRWRAQGLLIGRIAVNVSPEQLRDRNFIADLAQIVGVDAYAATGLELEITEGVMLEDVTASIATLGEIRAMGITVAIDDFGTGFSSLSYLAKLPADTLKIDRSFIMEMTQGPAGLTLVSAINSLAHGLKLKVVAEGVETDEQFRLLRLLGCDEMQGFLFSKAVPAEEFAMKYLHRS
jgi:diguanylate cyclase (GGDEF)-like protein/PAS domain S-box-containing protein